MFLRTKHHFTSTYDFRNDSLQFCEPFAHSLEWLYDEDNFEDERYWLYCMNGVMPIYVLMSLLKDIIIFAFDDYAEPNIKDYINRMESGNDQHGWNENEPFIKYEDEYLIVGKVHSFTTEVILWAAYLYFTFRTKINNDYKKAERGRKVLYKLYRQKAGVKEEYLKETFLMTHFNQAMITLVKNVPTRSSESKDEDRQKPQMEESVLDKISANNWCFYYEGWRNGKHGSICQTNGIYRFVEQARGKSGILAEVKRNNDEKPIVAIGIVAYWLMFNSKKELVLKRLTQYKNRIPQDIRELFNNYTQERFRQFKELHRDDPETWDWDWEKEFYINYVIPHEIALNKQSEALFEYISDSDIALVRAVMNSYIKYLKKICAENGYQVNLKECGFDGKRPSFREITWEEEKQCFKSAVLCVMEKKRDDGSYLFKKNTQWIAVYRFAVDIAIMYDVDDPNEPKDSDTPQYKKFEDFARELQLDVNPPTRLPFTKNDINSINSNKSYVRYNARYPWSKDGIIDPRSFTFYAEMEDVYRALQEEYNNLVSQAERTID